MRVGSPGPHAKSLISMARPCVVSFQEDVSGTRQVSCSVQKYMLIETKDPLSHERLRTERTPLARQPSETRSLESLRAPSPSGSIPEAGFLQRRTQRQSEQQQEGLRERGYQLEQEAGRLVGPNRSNNLRQMGFHHDGQAGLELLTSGDPLTSASQSARISGVSHRAQPGRSRFVTQAQCHSTIIAQGSLKPLGSRDPLTSAS
ncbi:hypothetical protein AAY473_014620 [Plecturocebus cupreus]